MFKGPIECEIAVEPAGGRHPVKHKAAAAMNVCFVHWLNSNVRYGVESDCLHGLGAFSVCVPSGGNVHVVVVGEIVVNVYLGRDVDVFSCRDRFFECKKSFLCQLFRFFEPIG